MDRSLWAVLAGTFTLRFSTGLTGAMLGVYLANLPAHGGEPVSPIVVGLFTATFYLAELVLSPAVRHPLGPAGPPPGDALRSGLRGGRGHPHRPHDEPAPPRRDALAGGRLDGREHPVDPRLHRDGHGRQRAAARPGVGPLRGRDAGSASAPASRSPRSCSRRSGPTAFFLNAVLYGVSFLIFRTASRTRPASAASVGRAARRVSRRYGELLRSSHVWLLAPTWIAVNASIGLWFSQSIFQFAKADPRVPGPGADARLHAGPDLASRPSSSGSSSASGCCTGATASRTCGGRRSSCTGSSAAAALVGGGPRRQPRRRRVPDRRRSARRSRSRASACS